MNVNLTIGSFAGIPVKIHWSFSFLILFIAFIGFVQKLDTINLVWFSLLMATLFLCVVLHEFGHALMARRYGINTKDIILSPIGGIARLDNIPDQPKQELLIALAGPLVNIVIAIVIGIIVHFGLGQSLILVSSDFQELTNVFVLLQFVFWMNITLFTFNLIPAFPMDGGRVLRALLAMITTRKTATKIAVIIGRIIAIGFFIIAIWQQYLILGIIAAFVFIMAGFESRQVVLDQILSSKPIGELSTNAFTKIYLTDKLSRVMEIVKAGKEENFLVFDSEDGVVGSIPEQFLNYARENDLSDQYVSHLMSEKFQIYSYEKTVSEVIEEMNNEGATIAVIEKAGSYIGIVDRHIITKWMKTIK